MAKKGHRLLEEQILSERIVWIRSMSSQVSEQWGRASLRSQSRHGLFTR